MTNTSSTTTNTSSSELNASYVDGIFGNEPEIGTPDCITADNDQVTVDRTDITVDHDCTLEVGPLTDNALTKIADQYRESPKLLGTIRNFVSELEFAARIAAAIPSYFDLDTAVGHQLTLLGKRLGFPRCHCICVIPPIVGFLESNGETYSGPYDIVGACVQGSTMIGCDSLGNGTVCIDNDETYRTFLKVRRYQLLGMFDFASLQDSIEQAWGITASVANYGTGTIVLAPGRALTLEETTLISVLFRILPVAPGIKAMVHYGDGPVVGFGAGWAGACENGTILCPENPYTYTCS